MTRGVAQPGSASGLGPEGRRFESCLPDHKLNDQLAVNNKHCIDACCIPPTVSVLQGPVAQLDRATAF